MAAAWRRLNAHPIYPDILTPLHLCHAGALRKARKPEAGGRPLKRRAGPSGASSSEAPRLQRRKKGAGAGASAGAGAGRRGEGGEGEGAAALRAAATDEDAAVGALEEALQERSLNKYVGADPLWTGQCAASALAWGLMVVRSPTD